MYFDSRIPIFEGKNLLLTFLRCKIEAAGSSETFCRIYQTKWVPSQLVNQSRGKCTLITTLWNATKHVSFTQVTFTRSFCIIFIFYFCLDGVGCPACFRSELNLKFRILESVGLFGRVISPSQGRFLHRTTQPQNKRRHPCLEWDSNSRSHCLSWQIHLLP
jgi:hypothetical protein